MESLESIICLPSLYAVASFPAMASTYAAIYADPPGGLDLSSIDQGYFSDVSCLVGRPGARSSGRRPSCRASRRRGSCAYGSAIGDLEGGYYVKCLGKRLSKFVARRLYSCASRGTGLLQG